MFFHNLKYELLTCLRAPSLIAWLMIFPIFLGTVFYVGFGSIYDNVDVFGAIPTAVVEIKESETFTNVIESVSGGDSKLLSVTRTNEEEALEMLKKGDVKGIIFSGDKVTLTVGGKGIQETILKSFVEQYSVYESIITDTIKNDPARVQDVVAALSSEVKACTEVPMTEGDPNPYAQYFYNLIAMVAIFGSVTGLHITEVNQANMSTLGARRNCSPTPKSLSLGAALCGSFIAQAVCMVICVSFIAFVLKINFGDRLPLVYAAAIIGGCLGVTMGFFIGSIGKLSSEIKNGIAMVVSMAGCFLSGLMVGTMKALIAEKIPWFNNVNPVAIISDCFYCLNIYSDFDRFNFKMISMLIYIVIFMALGIVLSRRKKYASI